MMAALAAALLPHIEREDVRRDLPEFAPILSFRKFKLHQKLHVLAFASQLLPHRVLIAVQREVVVASTILRGTVAISVRAIVLTSARPTVVRVCSSNAHK